MSARWQLEALKQKFRYAIEKLEQEHLLCFVDALDECPEDQVRDLIEFFESLSHLAIMNQIHLHVCFSSRHYPHLSIGMGLQLVLEEQEGHLNDITTYLSTELEMLHRRVKNLMMVQDDETVTYFFWIIYKFARRGKLDSIFPTLERISATAAELLTHTHPLARVFSLVLSYLSESDSGSILPVIDTTLRSIVDSFRYALGALHHTTTSLQNLYTSIVVMPREPDKAISDVRKITRCLDEECRGPQDLRAWQAHIYLMLNLASQGSQGIQEAVYVAAEMLEKTQMQDFLSQWVDNYQREAHCLMGIGQMELGKVDSGISHLSAAIDIAVRLYGVGDAKALYLRDKLEHYLRRWGRLQAAEEIA